MKRLGLIAILLMLASAAQAATPTAVFTNTTAPTASPTPTPTPTPTATITNTPTITPTYGPTPFDVHMPGAFTDVPGVKWASKAAVGTVIGPEQGTSACILAFELYSTDGTTETTITDGNSNVIFATKGTLAMTLGTLGPCLATPVTFTGAPKGSIAWH